MGLLLKKTDNELILRRRRRIRLKKLIMTFILLVSLCVILCLKLPYFNISDIEVYGSKNIPKSSIIELSKIYYDNNIFYVNSRNAANNILSNPYISDVNIDRKFPSTIQINVKERQAFFYVMEDNKYFVIDGNGVLLEKRNDVNNMKLIKLNGINLGKKEIGKPVENGDKRKIGIINSLSNIFKDSSIASNITLVDVSNSIDLKVYYRNICIKLGDEENVEKKFNRALNIIQKQQLQDANGYINVSFNGNPVFFIQN